MSCTQSHPVLFYVDSLDLIRAQYLLAESPHLAQCQLPTIDPLPRTAVLSQMQNDSQTITIAILPTIQQESRRGHAHPRRELQSFVRHSVGASLYKFDLRKISVGGVCHWESIRRREGAPFPGLEISDVVIGRI